jgi:hypothetical protein
MILTAKNLTAKFRMQTEISDAGNLLRLPWLKTQGSRAVFLISESLVLKYFFSFKDEKKNIFIMLQWTVLVICPDSAYQTDGLIPQVVSKAHIAHLS